MKIPALNIAIVAALVASTPAAAADLAFRYKKENVGALQGYNGRPYWRMLSECAGIYGALSNRYENQGNAAAAEAAKTQGVAFAKAATARLQADRSLAPSDALALIGADVDAGRASGEALFREPPARGLRHEQVLDLFCSQIDQAHTKAARFTR